MSKPNDAGEIRDFLAILADMPHTERELAKTLHDVLAGVEETNNQGTVTLSIKIVPSKTSNTVEFVPTVTGKRPKMPVRGRTFYLSQGNPVVEDPTQRALFEEDEEIRTPEAPASEAPKSAPADEPVRKVSE